MMNTAHPYFGKEVIVTSKHEKSKVMQAAFTSLLDIKLIELPLDTDQLGTFSGEVERVAPPLETAIAKAKLGINHSGSPLGIASEGSIGSDISIPWVSADYEVMVFVDAEHDVVISESLVSRDIIAAKAMVRVGDLLDDFLQRADFPHHSLIVQSLGSKTPFIVKGIRDLSALTLAIKEGAGLSPTGQVSLESDFRAMHSPSRQRNIAALAQLLATRIASLCPGCQAPGWGKVAVERGVPCSQCGEVNNQAIAAEILGCVQCEKRATGKIVKEKLDPAQCQFCNP